MQCVEFEDRLNHLLDDRANPSVDAALLEHAQNCARCRDLLAAHEVLLEGVQALPAVRLTESQQHALVHRVVAEVGSTALEPFPGDSQTGGGEVELADGRPTVVATVAVGPLALIGLVLATAAALLVALLPWFRADEQPAAPAGNQPLIAERQEQTPLEPNSPEVALASAGSAAYEDLEPIARVGYQVADGLTPVTSSMVSALRELRKRPFFRNAEEQRRSSFYFAHDDRELSA